MFRHEAEARVEGGSIPILVDDIPVALQGLASEIEIRTQHMTDGAEPTDPVYPIARRVIIGDIEARVSADQSFNSLAIQ